MSQNHWIVARTAREWGDYGHVLYHGWLWDLDLDGESGQVDTVVIHDRIGPFCPDVMLPAINGGLCERLGFGALLVMNSCGLESARKAGLVCQDPTPVRYGVVSRLDCYRGQESGNYDSLVGFFGEPEDLLRSLGDHHEDMVDCMADLYVVGDPFDPDPAEGYDIGCLHQSDCRSFVSDAAKEWLAAISPGVFDFLEQ